MEKIRKIDSLHTIHCPPCRYSDETILSIPKIKGRANLYFNHICGVEPTKINQGRLARYLRDRIRHQSKKTVVPFTQDWILSFLTRSFNPNTVRFPYFSDWDIPLHFQDLALSNYKNTRNESDTIMQNM